jgi:hypothetical protein
MRGFITNSEILRIMGQANFACYGTGKFCLASGYAFRSEQGRLASADHLATYIRPEFTGRVAVCDIATSNLPVICDDGHCDADESCSDCETDCGPCTGDSPIVCPPYEPLAPTGGGQVRTVSNTSQMNAALAAAQPGNTINLNTGVYGQLAFRQSLGHSNGNASAPIVIQAGSGQSPVIDAGGKVNWSRAIYVSRRDHVWVRGLEARNAVFGITFQGVNGGGIQHNHVTDISDAGIAVQGYWDDHADGSTFIDIACNELHNIHNSNHVGEGIYLGHGSGDLAITTHDIDVRLNNIYDISSDAIEIKSPVYNVNVLYNYIHDITFNNGYGRGIAVAPFNGSIADGNYLVEGNIIHNIDADFNSAIAIMVGDGTTTIRNNLIFDIEDWAIAFQPNSPTDGHGFGSWRNVYIYNNTMWNCGSSGCLGTHPLAVLTVTNNLTATAAPTGNNRQAASGDFVGPITGTADSGGGPGSGFVLDGNSGAVNSAATLPGFNTDLNGTIRPVGSGWDYGAFERP